MLANVLAIALLVVGTTATAAAFGGKTWKEGEEPILERITTRGWVSVACLVLALLFGIGKQAADSGDKKAANDKLVAENEANAQKVEDLKRQLTTANQQLTDVNAQLAESKVVGVGLTAKSEAQLKNLKDERESIGYLRADQRAAREDVVRSGNLNLIAAMAGGDRHVVDFDVALPLTRAGTKSKSFAASFLPNFKTPGCQDRTSTRVTVGAGPETSVDFRYQAGDSEHFHYQNASGHHGLQAADQLRPSDDLAQSLATEVGQTSSNGTLYIATLHDMHARQFGSELLAYLLRKGSRTPEPGSNGSSGPTNVLTITVGDTALPGATRSFYPTSCGKELYRYYHTAFQKAYYAIHLSDKPAITVYFRLKAELDPYDPAIQPTARKTGLPPVLRFWIEPTPFLLPGDSGTLMRMDWEQHTLTPEQAGW